MTYSTFVNIISIILVIVGCVLSFLLLKDIHYHSQNKIDASVIIKKDNEINKDITLNKENNEIIIKLDSKDERE